MGSIETSIDIDVPVSTAYNQWTQYESFPRFMKGIESVKQITDETVEFRGKIGGKERSWTAKIVEQTPDKRISWRAIYGADNQGTVLFEPRDGNRTKLTILLDYDPETIVEKTGDALGIFEARVRGDLERFKEFIESRGVESGSWRGEIHGGVRS